VSSLTATTIDRSSHVNYTMGGIVKASIDEYIKEVMGLQERDVSPGTDLRSVLRADPKYREAEERTEILGEALKGLLSPEGCKLLNDYEDALTAEMAFEVNYSYKHGFIDGVAHSQIPSRWAQDIGKTLPLRGGETR